MIAEPKNSEERIASNANEKISIVNDNFLSLRPPEKTKLGDLVVGGALIAFTLPLMAIVALVIKLDSPGPVFHRQERIRLRYGRFIVLKFRTTIHRGGLDDRRMKATGQCPRLTRVGRFLRHTRIENLPQLVNVLRGEMSTLDAGPERPHFLD